MFNRLPKCIHMLSSCSVFRLKSQLDSYLRNIYGLPCRPGFNNRLDGRDCLHYYADNLAAKETEVSIYNIFSISTVQTIVEGKQGRSTMFL